jgi:ribosomal protein S18 acetylase RimI-like enzyme
VGRGDKFVFGIYDGAEMVGCIDLIRGYPDRATGMLGLLLLSQKVRGRGLGKRAYLELERFISQWAGVDTVRIGVVATNARVTPFWEALGFKDTGTRKPYENGQVKSETWVLEKKVVSAKSRYSMRAPLKLLGKLSELKPVWESRSLLTAEHERLGILMERAYRGTIDDEGETTAQFLAEAKETLNGRWGDFISASSFCILQGNRMASATVVTLWKNQPLLAYSVTDPDFQGRGMARQLITQTMTALGGLGYTELNLGVTRGNTPAEKLYLKLGFEVVP